ncbi:hypothetical protein GUJ93_ZPchr0005g16030 [Zizania palustris]|uniref:Uncharacterized protein n=1 Tax=Zizania palustris TaxID=103762 RepID=A0A8J5SC41_ZIZPA|nr:hypothetical protein GUJ93_ZPchr0005g16030 [Zizania palustris]
MSLESEPLDVDAIEGHLAGRRIIELLRSTITIDLPNPLLPTSITVRPTDMHRLKLMKTGQINGEILTSGHHRHFPTSPLTVAKAIHQVIGLLQ